MSPLKKGDLGGFKTIPGKASLANAISPHGFTQNNGGQCPLYFPISRRIAHGPIRCSITAVPKWMRVFGGIDPGRPEEIFRRTGVRRHENVFRFPFFNQEAVVDVDRQRVFRAGAPEEEPGFRLCLITVFYLLFVDTAGLGPPVSPLELTGATTFFQSRGPHAIPSAPLEDRFGRDLAGFLEAGRRLGAERRASGDGALAFPVYPGLAVEVILWVADDEFPAQVSFMVPSGLDRFWQLDAVLGLMGLVVKELLRTAAPLAG